MTYREYKKRLREIKARLDSGAITEQQLRADLWTLYNLYNNNLSRAIATKIDSLSPERVKEEFTKIVQSEMQSRRSQIESLLPSGKELVESNHQCKLTSIEDVEEIKKIQDMKDELDYAQILPYRTNLNDLIAALKDDKDLSGLAFGLENARTFFTNAAKSGNRITAEAGMQYIAQQYQELLQDSTTKQNVCVVLRGRDALNKAYSDHSFSDPSFITINDLINYMAKISGLMEKKAVAQKQKQLEENPMVKANPGTNWVTSTIYVNDMLTDYRKQETERVSRLAQIKAEEDQLVALPTNGQREHLKKRLCPPFRAPISPRQAIENTAVAKEVGITTQQRINTDTQISIEELASNGYKLRELESTKSQILVDRDTFLTFMQTNYTPGIQPLQDNNQKINEELKQIGASIAGIEKELREVNMEKITMFNRKAHERRKQELEAQLTAMKGQELALSKANQQNNYTISVEFNKLNEYFISLFAKYDIPQLDIHNIATFDFNAYYSKKQMTYLENYRQIVTNIITELAEKNHLNIVNLLSLGGIDLNAIQGDIVARITKVIEQLKQLNAGYVFNENILAEIQQLEQAGIELTTEDLESEIKDHMHK